MRMTEKPTPTAQDLQLFMRALDQFGCTGTSCVSCDACGSLIRFEVIESVTRHECDCGKFTGVLRGF